MKRNLIFPLYSKEKVNNAAKKVEKYLRNGEQIDNSLEEIIENWRASHTHVLNVWQKILSKRTKKNKNRIVFAQRLKRKKNVYRKSNSRPGTQKSR